MNPNCRKAISGLVLTTALMTSGYASEAATPTTAPAATPTTVATAVTPVMTDLSQTGTWAPPKVTLVAAAKARLTPVYDSPSSTKPFKTFDNRLNFSGRHVFVVLAQEGQSYKVLLPMRPNGKTGYVRASDVALFQHDYALKVDLSDHQMTVYRAGQTVATHIVAVGQAKYPTPTGTFFLRELARPGNPKGSYGPWAFGLSAYSNVLQKFGRGDGQIGIHGTNQPAALGTSASHGCIRMKNETITTLAKTLPQGVLIEIVP